MEYNIKSLEDLSVFTDQFVINLEQNKIFLLFGEMGVGKTTFVQYLLQKIGNSDLSGSPTYSLVNSYKSENYGEIHHLDLYRLQNTEEAYDIGLEEILDGNSFCFIEWPEKIIEFLPNDFCSMQFTLNEDFSRTIKISNIKKV